MAFVPRSFRSLSLAMCVLSALALPAHAQQRGQRIQIGDLIQRIDRLESEVQRLRVSPRPGGGSDVARLDQIEQELRRLTGIIERLDFESRKAAAATDKRMDGFEERLQALDNNRMTAVPPSAIPEDRRPPKPQSFDTPSYSPTAGAAAPFGPQQPPAYTPSAVSPTFGGGTAQSADSLYDEGLRLLNIGSFDQAGAQFEDLIASHPQDPKAGQAQYWLGDMHFKLGRYEQAASAFLDSFRNWPEGPKAPDSLLKLGMTLANIGKTEEACLSFKQVSARYPSAPPSLLRRANIEGQRYRCGS